MEGPDHGPSIFLSRKMQRPPNRRCDDGDHLCVIIIIIDAGVGKIFFDNRRISLPQHDRLLTDHHLKRSFDDQKRLLGMVDDGYFRISGMWFECGFYHQRFG